MVHRIFGFYSLFGDYTLVISDPLIIKQIMIKDFEYFVNRDRVDPSKADKLLGKSILMLRDQKWKDMRSSLSPVYTSSKLKQMYELLQECVADFMNLFEEKALKAQGEVIIDTHDVLARVTADGIATTALGFKGDCTKNKDSEIFKIAMAVEADFQNPNSLIFLNVFPALCKLLGIEIFRKSVHQFFEENVLGEIKRRRDLNIHRPDVIDLLIQAKNGKLTTDPEEETDEGLAYMKTRENTFNWSDEDLVAQALVFFLGGFDTTATLMQSYFWELSQNPDVQQTLIDEVDEMVNTLDGKPISYEQLTQMKYLDMVINETLRKWPSFRITSRLCSKDYTFSTDDGKKYTIKKGIELFIPIGSIQMNPKYFKEPEKFDPSRFSDKNKKNIQSFTFLPFGTVTISCLIHFRHRIMIFLYLGTKNLHRQPIRDS